MARQGTWPVAAILALLALAAPPAAAQNRTAGVQLEVKAPSLPLFTLPPDQGVPSPDEPLPYSRRIGAGRQGSEAGNGTSYDLGTATAREYRAGPGRTLNGGVATGVELPRGPGFLSVRRDNPAVGRVDQ